MAIGKKLIEELVRFVRISGAASWTATAVSCFIGICGSR